MHAETEKRRRLVQALRDGVITLCILGAALLFSLLLRSTTGSDGYAAMFFIFAVFLVSRFTHGHFYGTIASIISVLAVNYVFTYPYFKFSFSISSYPVLMLCMLVVAITTSTLTTQIKQAGDIRIKAEKEKARGDLLRAVSHDLRTPLTCILGATSAIIENDERLSREERLKLLSEIKDDSQWLIRMVENLLSITRIDGEQAAEIRKTPEAAEELVAETVQNFKKRFPRRAVTVEVPRALLLVPMDAMLIEQVLMNLLENAVLHGAGTHLSLIVRKYERFAEFEVRDDGCGIEPALLPHLFDGYLKSMSGSGDGRRNMGIGLSVCQTIIRAHNGTLSAENAPGGGAVFRFTLPLSEDKNGR